eukprot:1163062-Rhodomonas_salina.3
MSGHGTDMAIWITCALSPPQLAVLCRVRHPNIVTFWSVAVPLQVAARARASAHPASARPVIMCSVRADWGRVT